MREEGREHYLGSDQCASHLLPFLHAEDPFYRILKITLLSLVILIYYGVCVCVGGGLVPTTHISNTSAEDRDDINPGELLRLAGQPSHQKGVSSRFSERHYLKGIACRATEEDPGHPPLTFTHMNTGMHTCRHIEPVTCQPQQPICRHESCYQL